LSKTLGVDIAFQKDDVDRWMRRLVVFDMDSTLIQQEVIDELARYAGVEDEVKTITEAAMRGELNFFESLKSRVALLKGHNAEELFSKVKKNLLFTPGAKKLCSTLRKLGFKMAVISGGFMPVAREVQRELGLDYAFANVMEVDENTGLLTGRTTGPVVTPQRKKALLATIADVEGCELKQTIAVGDGANDIPMLHTAGLGIAFCAKPKVQAVTEYRINQQDLSTVLFLLGVSEHAAERLA
jgi:phosphoserine phosphatase SerB